MEICWWACLNQMWTIYKHIHKNLKCWFEVFLICVIRKCDQQCQMQMMVWGSEEIIPHWDVFQIQTDNSERHNQATMQIKYDLPVPKYKVQGHHQLPVQSYGEGVKRDINRRGQKREDQYCDESRCSRKSCVFNSVLKERGSWLQLWHGSGGRSSIGEQGVRIICIAVPGQTALLDKHSRGRVTWRKQGCATKREQTQLAPCRSSWLEYNASSYR